MSRTMVCCENGKGCVAWTLLSKLPMDEDTEFDGEILGERAAKGSNRTWIGVRAGSDGSGAVVVNRVTIRHHCQHEKTNAMGS